jgi:hypothetical protein
MRRDHKAGRTETALHGACLDERVLHRVQLISAADALDRDDVSTVRLTTEHETGADQGAIHIDRAGSALALLAGILGTRQLHPVAQH